MFGVALLPVWGREWDYRKAGVLDVLPVVDHVNGEEEGIFGVHNGQGSMGAVKRPSCCPLPWRDADLWSSVLCSVRLAFLVINNLALSPHLTNQCWASVI